MRAATTDATMGATVTTGTRAAARAAADGWRLPWLVTLLAAVVLLLGGCQAQLAPSYNPSIAGGVQKLNSDAQTFYASVAAGVPASSFGDRSTTYATLIGEANALQTLAKSRPDPDFIPGFIEKRIKSAAEIPTLAAPTADILGNISTGLAKMRDSDQAAGLTALEVQAFQNQFQIFMGQALTYENALQR